MSWRDEDLRHLLPCPTVILRQKRSLPNVALPTLTSLWRCRVMMCPSQKLDHVATVLAFPGFMVHNYPTVCIVSIKSTLGFMVGRQAVNCGEMTNDGRDT
jgi:hypothetical protein